MGLQEGDDNLYTLHFANDQVIIAEDGQDLSYMISKLNEKYSLAGLKIMNTYLTVGSDKSDNKMH